MLAIIASMLPIADSPQNTADATRTSAGWHACPCGSGRQAAHAARQSRASSRWPRQWRRRKERLRHSFLARLAGMGHAGAVGCAHGTAGGMPGARRTERPHGCSVLAQRRRGRLRYAHRSTAKKNAATRGIAASTLQPLQPRTEVLLPQYQAESDFLLPSQV